MNAPGRGGTRAQIRRCLKMIPGTTPIGRWLRSATYAVGKVSRSNKYFVPFKYLWKRSLAEEMGFWDSWLASKGLDWPDDYRRRCNPGQPLQDYVAKHLDLRTRGTIRILDVGAGPMTVVGKRHGRLNLAITAVDALADVYDRLLQTHGVVPPVRTVPGEAERLLAKFPRNTFDVVHAENSLDHCYNPLLAIRQMLEVTKPNGIVLLRHAENEGQRRGYEGLHLWNFRIENGELILWNQRKKYSINVALDGAADVRVEMSDGLVVAAIRKGPARFKTAPLCQDE